MLPAPIPVDEEARQCALNSTTLLDTDPAPEFDALTRIAQYMLDAPIALVSLVDRDRQWFKSRVGVDVTETPRDISFCGHAILHREPLVIEDATQDDRFRTNPFVEGDAHIRFYVGVPLLVDNQAIGTICIADTKPRRLQPGQLEVLINLGKMAEQQIAVLRQNAELMRSSITDPLTGLFNRRGLEELGNPLIARAKRDFKPVTCLFFDLNGLKAINDAGGHKAGDAAIIGFAKCLKSVSRSSDVVSRLAGDEYVILMAGSTTDGAKELCDRLDTALLEYNRRDRGFLLSYSAGFATLKPHQPFTALIAEADAAMYQNKAARKRAV